MSKYSDAKELAGLTLGKKTEYANQYDASLLQPVPRSLNRDDLELGDTLPFLGHDILDSVRTVLAKQQRLASSGRW